MDSSNAESKTNNADNTDSNNSLSTESNPKSINSHNTTSHKDMIQSYKDRGNATLQVYLNGNTLTLLNYSLLDSSLNIKLESNSKESQVILEKEQAQREQKDKDSQTQDSSLTASNDNSQSTALLHPILEDNEIKCPHNGVVRLKANKGKTFISKIDSLYF